MELRYDLCPNDLTGPVSRGAADVFVGHKLVQVVQTASVFPVNFCSCYDKYLTRTSETKSHMLLNLYKQIQSCITSLVNTDLCMELVCVAGK